MSNNPTTMTYFPNIDPTRIGDWIQTFSGLSFWPLDPRPEEIQIEDIAHALAMRCRYGGHCTKFYSVAEHSVLVSRYVRPEHALWGLLHDAAEAYSADIPRPLKRCLRDWKPLEARIMAAVCVRFGLPQDEPADVGDVDFAMTTDERAALMADCARDWGRLPPPVGAKIIGLDPVSAKILFLNRFAEITP
jgi:5'-deoxynucleotidase YfbR-like HD superfamily hydrolase